MPHVTSMLMAGLAAVGAWGLVVPSADSASKMPGAGAADMLTSMKGDRMSLSGLRRSDENMVTTVEVVAVKEIGCEESTSPKGRKL
jgi:hypothetical protein